MNTDFLRIICSSTNDRYELFLSTARRLGTSVQNIEKDFWVTFLLDLLFNGRNESEPRLLFKGGTSLSKSYGLISRFSEDIDITVFREDIDQKIEVNLLENLSGKKQRAHLESIKNACQKYIGGSLKDRLNLQIKSIFNEAGVPFVEPLIINDPSDADQQTLLLLYPSVNLASDDYIKPMVKIEAGAKSALDPHRITSVKPYIAHDTVDLNLSVPNVVTIDAERTFWDKVVILHGLRRWHDNRGVLRQKGHRISRHYYDIYKLIRSPIG
ncbi:MAG TPA: nucleotidyl transferase AbiEii/AbiGii toxin family protein, partial [Gammaproteobacteria bacterium]|nr:nucleotidyl transferase AbiEii/AbiGii toxin family protein [Gammaproteobacteria bacterium]